MGKGLKIQNPSINARWGEADEADDLRADPSTMALAMVDYPHYEVHQGNAFAIHYTRTTANTDDHRTGIGFTTPAGLKAPHVTFRVTASQPAEAMLMEAPTIDADPGTNVAVHNRNRVLDTAATVGSLEATPTVDEITTLDETEFAAATFSGGTMLDHVLLAGGEGPKAIGGQGRGAQEWILKPSTKYVIYIQNVGANVNIHCINLDWYEHTPKH